PLGTGALDTGGGATSAGFYNAVDRGIELRIVADKGMSVDGYDYKALVVRKDLIDGGAFKSLADLKGKKVAIVAQGAADESVLHQALLKGGHLRFWDQTECAPPWNAQSSEQPRRDGDLLTRNVVWPHARNRAIVSCENLAR